MTLMLLFAIFCEFGVSCLNVSEDDFLARFFVRKKLELIGVDWMERFGSWQKRAHG